jgi:hypothetical protein
MIRIGALLAFLFVGASSSYAASNCEVMGIDLIRDVTVTGYMYVKAGKQCGIQSASSIGGNISLELKQRPSNGSAQVDGFRVTYKPRAGFVGKDSFVYVRHQRDARTNQAVTYPVNVDVTVQP